MKKLSFLIVLGLLCSVFIGCSDSDFLSDFSKRKYLKRHANEQYKEDQTTRLYASIDPLLEENLNVNGIPVDTIVLLSGKVIFCKIKKKTNRNIFYYEFITKNNVIKRQRLLRDFVTCSVVYYYTQNGKRNYISKDNELGFKISPHTNQLDTIVNFDGDTMVGNVYDISKKVIYYTQKTYRKGKYKRDESQLALRKKIKNLHIDGVAYDKLIIDPKWETHERRRNRPLGVKIMLTILIAAGIIGAVLLGLLIALIIYCNNNACF